MACLIKISPELDFSTKIKSVNLALGIGFETITTTFPIVEITDQDNIDKLWKQWSNREYTSVAEPSDHVNATTSAKEIPPYDWRKDKGLESVFDCGPLLPDNNLDLLPDALNLKIVLSPTAAIETIAAACNFAFRLGMETTAYQGSIVAEPGYKGNRIIFTEEPGFSVRLLEYGDATIVEVSGAGSELVTMSSQFLESFPNLGPGLSWSELLMYLVDSFTMRNTDGQLSALKLLTDQGYTDIRALISEQKEDKLEQIRSYFPAASVDNYKKGVLIYEKEYEIPWENDIFLSEIEKHILPQISEGDKVEIYGVLSEDLASRQALTDKVRKKIETKQAQASVAILNAFKQGVSWIMDFVIPELKDLEVGQITIAFNSFLPPGEDSWTDESASTPKYNMSADGGADHWNDLPIRFLQELYPVDDLIEMTLGLERDKVNFVLYEGNEELSYRLQVYDNNGKEIYRADYKAEFSERPYLDRFPLLGKVHPSTGQLIAVINGETVYKTSIKTDVERIWEIYQEEVLEDCLDFVTSKYKDKITADKQPFFSLLDIDIQVSEPDERLGVREDLLSSLDSLHEDIYFAGTDFFKHLGINLGVGVLDAPGLILPRIKKHYGKPVMKVKLYDQLAIGPSVQAADKVFTVIARDKASVLMRSISYQEDGWSVKLEVEGIEPRIVKSLSSLVDSDLLELSDMLPGVRELIFNEDANNAIRFPIAPTKEKETKDIRHIDLCESELIGYEKYSRIIEELKSVPGLEVYPIADSYLGRTLHAIELVGERKGYTSRVKRLTHFPSLYINARHHANEVSSTNAAFILIKQLLTDPKYQDLAERLNLVLVPMENPDGTEIHYNLQKTNPYWSFHVARFNAIGKEFYYDHFNIETIHTEARGLRKLWYLTLPDIMVDNHGVPTHEWVQQFSGYVYPAFKGFWLPRSLLYGYFWHITDHKYASNFKVNKKMEEVIADKIAASEEITDLNLEWINRFEKYATQFMPKMFAANYYRNMINYWIPFEHDPTHRYPSIRFPWIVSVAYTSEVADETAQDEYLNLCARAHVTHNLATIDMMLESKHIYEIDKEVSEDIQSVRYIRQRPMLV